MQPTRRSGTTFVVLLVLAFAVLAQPASASGPRPDALREVPGALDRAEQPRTQSRSTAVAAAATGSPRGFPAVDLYPGTIAGYIPLDLFGGTLVTPIGDENLQTFNVPSFAYNGSTFDAVTVDSNGYAIPGSDDSSENNNCCDISLGPSRPNGILAPFWTDLDGTGAQGLLLNVLTDGVGTWIVIEWRVNDFGTLNPRTFQL